MITITCAYKMCPGHRDVSSSGAKNAKTRRTYKAPNRQTSSFPCSLVFSFSWRHQPAASKRQKRENDGYSPNSVVTLGVLTVIVKAGVARSRWRTGCPQISSLFSWFRACMFVSCVNSHSFRVAATGVNGFCL